MKWAAGAAKMAKPSRSMERGGVSPCVWPHLIFSVEQQERIEEEKKNRGGYISLKQNSRKRQE